MMLTRRFAIKAVAASIALLAARAGAARAAFGGQDASLNRVLAMLRDPAAASAVGRTYLAGAPALTRAHLLADLEPLRLDGAAAARDLAAQVGRAVRADFADGRIVTVDGWILSRTEASLCALAHLRGVG